MIQIALSLLERAIKRFFLVLLVLTSSMSFGMSKETRNSYSSTVVLINKKERPDVLKNWEDAIDKTGRVISYYLHENDCAVYKLSPKDRSSLDVVEMVYVFNEDIVSSIFEDVHEYPITKILLFNRETTDELMKLSEEDVKIFHPDE